MDKAKLGGWVYIMANRHRGGMYIGVTADLAHRVKQHRDGSGSDHCARKGLTRPVWATQGPTMLECIAHEKRLKRWHRQWKFDLIEQANPAWDDLFDRLL